MVLDESLFLTIQSLTGVPLIDNLMLFMADFLVLLVPLSLIHVWFQGREGMEDASYTALAAFAGLGASYLMGLLYFHENPSATFETLVAFEPENAFPSQHATAMFATALPLLKRGRKKIGWTVLAAAFMTGFARVYIGEHWPIDIFGAIIAAGIGLGLVYGAWSFIKPLREPVLDFMKDIQDKVFDHLPGSFN